jgi:hypothetical protein
MLLDSIKAWVSDVFSSIIDRVGLADSVNAAHSLLGYAVMLTAAYVGVGSVFRLILWAAVAVGMVAADLWRKDQKPTVPSVVGSLSNGAAHHLGAAVGFLVTWLL